MSFRPLQSYSVLKEHKSSTYNLVKWHFETIVRSIYRKISLKRKYKDPFTCSIFNTIHKDLFYKGFQAVRDYQIQFGRSIEVIKNRKGEIVTYIVKFEHYGAFKFHLKELSGVENIEDLFKRTFTCGSIGKIKVSAEKPAALTYKCRTNTLHFHIHYEITNKFGNITSY